LELFMRPALFVSLAALSCILATGCAKKDAENASIMTEDAASAPSKAEQKASADSLKSLTAEQQVAVRALIRDTLISNPEILVEASRAYEASQVRAQNEKVATNFLALKKDHAELAFGPANAKITMVEFFDYKCGFCHAANDWVWEVIEKRKDVRIIFKELPILSPNSTIAAKAAIAAHKQGKYKELHRAMMISRGDLSLEQVLQIAGTLGIDTARLQRDMADPKVEAQLAGVREQATALGINGTPGFVINGKLVSGFAKDQLEAAMGTAGVDAPAEAGPPPAPVPSKG
jgi:protein-disulfide isomerase